MALTFKASPRIDLPTFERVLVRANSPAAGAAAALYAIPLRYGLDPAVALAFFEHESSFGKAGKAVHTRNWGNLRKSQGNAYKVADGWAWYHTWSESLADWCALISKVYIPRGLDTVESAIPLYAPSSDNNKPASYIAAVVRSVAQWQAESHPSDLWALWGDAYPLPEEQRGFGIPTAWYESRGELGAAISDEYHFHWGAARFFGRGVIAWFRDDNMTRIARY